MRKGSRISTLFKFTGDAGKVLMVFRHELYTLVARWSFWLGLLFVPVAGGLVYGVMTLAQSQEGQDGVGIPFSVESYFQPVADQRPLGFVDPVGLVRGFPEGAGGPMPAAFEDEDSARQALQIGVIRGYYVITPTFLEGGPLLYYTDKITLASFLVVDPVFQQVVDFNLAGGNQKLFDALEQKITILHEDLSIQPGVLIHETSQAELVLPILIVMTLFISILGASSTMLNSFNREAQNRVMEVLLSSASSRQILWGKLLALWLVGIGSIVFLILSSAVMARLTGKQFQLSMFLSLPLEFLVWGVLFALLGYLFYGTIMMGIGTLLPYFRETSQVVNLFTLPMAAPMFFVFIFVNDPNGWVPVFLSIFPLTSSTSMLARMLYTQVPLWQLVLSCLVLLACTVWTVSLVERNFKPHHLFSEKELLGWLKDLERWLNKHAQGSRI